MPGPRLAAVGLMLSTLALAPAALAGQEQPAQPAAPPTPSTVFSSSRVIVEWAANADHADKAAARSDAEVAFEDLGTAASSWSKSTRASRREMRSANCGRTRPWSSPNATATAPPTPSQTTRCSANSGACVIPAPASTASRGLSPERTLTRRWPRDRAVGIPSTVIADIDSGYRFGGELREAVRPGRSPRAPGDSTNNGGNGLFDDIHGYDFVGPSADCTNQRRRSERRQPRLRTVSRNPHGGDDGRRRRTNGRGITGVCAGTCGSWRCAVAAQTRRSPVTKSAARPPPRSRRSTTRGEGRPRGEHARWVAPPLAKPFATRSRPTRPRSS